MGIIPNYRCLLVALWLLRTSAFAQDISYGRINLCTPITTDALKGAGVSFDFGKRVKGVDVSLSLGYYNKHWKDNTFQSIDYYDFKTSTSLLYAIDGKDRESEMSLMANVEYDILRFLKKNFSCHLYPKLGIGFAHKGTSFAGESEDDTWQHIEFRNHSENGFEMSFGGRFEYDINRHLSLGVVYDNYFFIAEKEFLGLSLKYSFMR